MLYENVFIISGQLSKKSADDYYDDLLKKIKDSFWITNWVSKNKPDLSDAYDTATSI